MKVNLLLLMMVSLTLIGGIDSAILSSFRNRQREIRKLYHTTGFHDCNAKSKTLKLIRKYPFNDRGYLPPKDTYSKNKNDIESAIAHLLLPPSPKKSLYEKFIHGDIGIKNKHPHDCRASAILKLNNV